METAIVSIALVIVVFIVLCIGAAVIWGSIKLYKTLDGLSARLDELNKQMTGVPALLDGIMRICKELSASTVQMTESVSGFKKAVLADQPSAPRRDESFRPYDDGEADREYQIKALIQAMPNLSYEQAREAVVAGSESGRFFVTE